ncbi:uncharacterized protein LOC131658501 [Vicia villosa]|uniref:uncharacterized protein LOC131658501 n=1 Tax=Vicia villosa TaxID=3911 RepID=UPI00273B4CAD|nr:uncharacterized protein LOC131658501 [Vicia villosa]
MEAWNKACMVRLLWNLCKKEDSMWVRWVHTYYIKEVSIMDVHVKDSFSWIMKEILQIREHVKRLDCWKSLGQRKEYKMKEFYLHFLAQSNDVDWKGLIMGNYARPRAKIIMWLACHGRLATKDRLVRFRMIKDVKCESCAENETMQHLFFECDGTNGTWRGVLDWLHIKQQECGLTQIKSWAIRLCKSKNWRRKFLHVALAETVYSVWHNRNCKVYRKK